jgi:uncharacterized protein YunC (DUF1805 family)
MGDTLPTNKVGVSLVWCGWVRKNKVKNMSAQENRTVAEQRANDLITQVRGAKEVSNAARQEIAELAQQASELGVSNGFTSPVVEALKQTAKSVCAVVLGIERTTTAFGKSATMTNLGHMLYQMHAKQNPWQPSDRKPRADKPTAEEKAWLRENRGNHWWSSDNGKTTDKVLKAANIADARTALAGAPAPEPMAEASNDTIDISSLTASQMEDLLNGLLNG